jgi:hypothetical protein
MQDQPFAATVLVQVEFDAVFSGQVTVRVGAGHGDGRKPPGIVLESLRIHNVEIGKVNVHGIGIQRTFIQVPDESVAAGDPFLIGVFRRVHVTGLIGAFSRQSYRGIRAL